MSLPLVCGCTCGVEISSSAYDGEQTVQHGPNPEHARTFPGEPMRWGGSFTATLAEHAEIRDWIEAIHRRHAPIMMVSIDGGPEFPVSLVSFADANPNP